MSRPLPVVRIIAKFCFYNGPESANSTLQGQDSSSTSPSSADPYTYEFTRVRIPAYATVSLVKESIIKLEPRFFALEPRQLAISIMSTISGSDTDTTHECNLDPSYERKLLTECHENIRYRYENHLPIILVFWVANFPSPPLQLDLPSIPVEDSKVDPAPPSISVPEPPKNLDLPSTSKSNASEADNSTNKATPSIGTSAPQQTPISFSDSISDIAVIEIDGVLVRDDDLEVLEGEDAEQVEEEAVVFTAPRTALVQLSALDLEQATTSSAAAAAEAKAAQSASTIYSQTSPDIVSATASSSLKNDPNRLSIASASVAASGIKNAMRMSAKTALNSNRITISDLLLEEQLWVKPDVLKEGWLMKRMKKSGKKEEQRWFQLRLDHHLYYFKDDAPNSVPLGRIPLAISTMEIPPDGKLDSFHVYYSQRNKERSLILASDDKPTLVSWIDVINRTMRDAKETYSASISQEGYLQKKGLGLKTWNRRYFVLKDGSLYHYLTSEDAKLRPEQPRGKLSLEDCYVTVNSGLSSNLSASSSNIGSASINSGNASAASNAPVTSHIFRIHVSNETLLFMASSFSELQQWLSAINEERDTMREIAHLRDTIEAVKVVVPLSKTEPASFKSFHWSLLPIKKRAVPSVEFDLPFDDDISKHVDMELITSHVDTPQLRLIRHHHALVRARLIKRKAKHEIYDVLLAPLTRLAPSVPLPDLINVRFHFGESSVAVKCPIYASIVEGTAMAIDLLIRRKIFPAHIRADDFVVKLCGSRQYLLDMDANFADVIHVREQLGRGRTFVEVMLHTKVAVIAEISNATWAEQLVEQQFYNLPLGPSESAIAKSFAATSTQPAKTGYSSDPDSEDDLDQLLEQLVDIRRGPEEIKAPTTLGDMKRRSKSANSSASSSLADLSPAKILRNLCIQSEEECYAVSDVRGHPFSVRVVSLKNFSYAILESVVPQEAVDNSKPEARISFFIQTTLFYGNRAVGDPVRTAKRLTPFFNQTLDLKVDCSQLAPEMRIGVTLYVNHASKDLPLAWLNVPVSDYAGRIHRGSFEAGMWIQPKAAHPVGSCESDSSRALLLCLEFEKPPLPLVFLDTTTLPPNFELRDPPVHPLRAPYKSELSIFRRTHPSKSHHPLLGDDSLFGMSTFNKLQEQQTKQPAIGSSRSRIFGSGGSPSSLSTRNASNPNIVLGARRSPQPSVGTESTSSTANSPVPRSALDGTSTSPTLGNSREVTPSTSPSPAGENHLSSSPIESPPTNSDPSPAEMSSSVSPPTPSSLLLDGSTTDLNGDALSRLNFVSARARKSFAVSMSPPVPMGKALSEANALSSSPAAAPSSSSGTPNTPTTRSNFAAALSTYQPDPVPSMTTAPPASTAFVEDPKSPLANTIWSKTAASTNLGSFAQKVSPNLTTARLVAHLQEIDRICKLDPLTPLSDTQKQLLWGYRKQLIEKPETFPKLFLAPNLLNVSQREELHRMVKTAPLMPPEMALQLLDHRYPDSHVRAYAVRCLVNFGDEELASYLLQLVQVLQYEANYLAPLASFLVERAILNPLLIGQGLLWHLQAELYRPETETKFGILMEAILLGLKPSLRAEFAAQIEFVAKMVELNDQLQSVAPSSRTAFLRKHLANFATSSTKSDALSSQPPSSSQSSASLAAPSSPLLSKASSPAPMSSSPPPGSATSDENASLASSGASVASTPSVGWSSGHIKDDASSAAIRLGLPPLPPPSPTRLVLPLSSAMVVKGVIVEKCKVMDSAAFPLWLSFESEDPFSEPISVLFKFGDDLRQDALTLQMFTIMDRLWKREGMDLKMSLYKCLPTGPSMGMIEVVPEAETTARIQKEAGGIMGAFKQTPLSNWLKSYNSEPAMLEDAIENFTRSCAAYCVATYVIGVGDRHNDNIMVTKSGRLFHIDFAHFLGNIIKFGVYKRERAPFVLTPEFAYVMGGEKSPGFAQFKALACNIYNKLRKHSSTFISLFELMLFAGLSQLSSYDDIAYLKKSLLTTTSDSDAFDNFGKLIDESLSTKSTQLNFAIHIFAHPD